MTRQRKRVSKFEAGALREVRLPPEREWGLDREAPEAAKDLRDCVQSAAGRSAAVENSLRAESTREYTECATLIHLFSSTGTRQQVSQLSNFISEISLS